MNKIILVTGATSKLGIPLVDSLAEKNNIVYAGMRNIKNTPWKQNKRIYPVKLDVTSDLDVQRAVLKIIKRHRKIDCVIYSAGVTPSGPTLDFTTKQFLETLEVNTVGAFRVNKFAAEQMLIQKSGGKIINITSLNGLVSLPNFGLYSASKFALEALTSALRIEFKNRQIYFTSVAPGAIKTTIQNTDIKLPHKPLREKFRFLGWILKMTTEQEVIQAIIMIIETDNPPARVILGRDAFIVTSMQRFLPNIIWDKLNTFIWSK